MTDSRTPSDLLGPYFCGYPVIESPYTAQRVSTLGGEKMDLDQTTMCPKHGVAHGVCVNPIPVHAATDEIIRIDENGVVHCAENDHTGLPGDNPGVASNRFNPYEALDEIDEGVKAVVRVTRDLLQSDLNEALDVIYNQSHALRAYITGMKR